jgi:hypothetical protein
LIKYALKNETLKPGVKLFFLKPQPSGSYGLLKNPFEMDFFFKNFVPNEDV